MIELEERPAPTSVERERRRRRRAVLGWIPSLLMALVIAAVAVGGWIFTNSWWTDPDPRASDDQLAADNSSIFTPAGVDYFTRRGTVIIDLASDRLPASELGLEPSGEREFELSRPMRLAVFGESDGWSELVDAFTVTTSGDRVTRVDAVFSSNGDFGSIIGTLRSRADVIGWTDSDFDALDNALVDAQRAGDGGVYRAQLPAVTGIGAAVSATVSIDPELGVGLDVRIEAL